MSPFRSNDSPSLHDHFSEPSGTASTFASFDGLALRLIRRRFGAGAFGLALAVAAGALAVCADASGTAISIVVDKTPATAAISSLFMGENPLYRFWLNS